MTPLFNKIFNKSYWGRLAQFEIPHAIIQQDKLVFSPPALSMLLILLHIARSKQPRNRDHLIEVKVTQRRLNERSGFSKNVITKALKELEQRKFIKKINQRSRRGEWGANSYLICNPENGEPLQSFGNNFLWGNHIRYIRLPRCIVSESSARWSIAAMSSSEIRLYAVTCWLANKNRNNEFKSTVSELKSLAGFSRLETCQQAVDDLEQKHLIWVSGVKESGELDLHLGDPYTGEPLQEQTADAEDDPANYYETLEEQRARRVNLNTGGPEHVESLVRSCLSPDRTVISQNNGDITICCPFHDDAKPSCSVSPRKRCFYCFGCQKGGTVTQLVAALRGSSKGAAIRYMASHSGQSVDFHEPDKNAEAIYSYTDEKGKLLKQVLRYPNKLFRQRRPYKNGWVWNVNGVKPSLYNLHRVEFSRTVCICEGEKDCDTITGFSLKDADGSDVIAVTSGGADSWKDLLADSLNNQRVILLPDADEAGMRFAAQVVSSLTRRGIKYREVTFSDVGAKDAGEFLSGGATVEQLALRLGDWVMSPADKNVEENEFPVEP